MKITRYIHICLLLPLLLTTGCDKYVISDDQQLSFIKYYGLSADNEGIGVHQTKNGYIMIGNSGNVGNNSDIVVFTTDEFGNLTGEIKTLGTSNNEEVINVVRVENDNFLICARTMQSANNWDPYLIKISETGNIIWENRQYARENNNEILDAAELNNQYVLVGYVTNNDGVRQRWSVRWNLAGSEVSDPKIEGVDDQQIVSVYTNNEQIYILGHILRNRDNPDYDIFHAQLAENDNLTGVTYYNAFSNSSQSMNEFAVDMVGDANNRLILGYYESDDQSIPFLVNYARLDDNSSFQKNWELFIREDNIENVNSLSFNGNEILILANSPETSTGYEMKVFQTTLNATNYSTYNFGEEEVRLRGNKILHLSDGIGLVGSSLIGDNSSILFMKLRPDLTLQ